jgi:nucleotidyltransferase substrate binding protein (TIGR01987 family)
MLDVSQLSNALKTLQEAIVEYDKDKNNSFVRDSLVKRFEYTYEFSIRMLKRYLSATQADISQDELVSFKKLIRIGLDKKLLKSSVEKWSEYRDARNLTSHTYKLKNAESVISVAFDLAKEVEEYVSELEKRIKEEEDGR